MRLLANENFPSLAVVALRAAGHDVVWARADMPAASDEAVLRRAQVESRVIVTFDKDFGELAYHQGLPASCGVILFRLRMQSPEYIRDQVVAMLSQPKDWSGHFAVVDELRTRVRRLRGTDTRNVWNARMAEARGGRCQRRACFKGFRGAIMAFALLRLLLCGGSSAVEAPESEASIHGGLPLRGAPPLHIARDSPC